MNRRHLYTLSALLITSGLSVAIYKHRVLGYPLLPEESASLWSIEGHLTFERHTVGPVKARLKLPHDPPGFRILREDFVSRGYGQPRPRIYRVRGIEQLYDLDDTRRNPRA